jgi:hypothetical protein
MPKQMLKGNSRPKSKKSPNLVTLLSRAKNFNSPPFTKGVFSTTGLSSSVEQVDLELDRLIFFVDWLIHCALVLKNNCQWALPEVSSILCGQARLRSRQTCRKLRYRKFGVVAIRTYVQDWMPISLFIPRLQYKPNLAFLWD